jgi:type IV secretory system conjugative DNA transfer VirD4/TraG family protein
MAQQQRPSRRTAFEDQVDRLVNALIENADLAAQAQHHEAERDRKSAGIKDAFKRALLPPPPPPPSAAVTAEIEHLGEQLVALHRRLRGVERSQLHRNVAQAVREMPSVTEAARTDLRRALTYGRDQQGRTVGQLPAVVRAGVQQVLAAVTPASAVRRNSAVAAPDGSILPVGATALAAGAVDVRRIGAVLDHQAGQLWTQVLQRNGVEATLPRLTRDAGGDPVEAARLIPRYLKGVYLGTTLDPHSRKPTGPSVVNPSLTMLALGAAGSGKTTGVIGPYAVNQAALGHNVVLVTPQSATLELIVPTAKAVTGQEHVPMIDFGGRIISRDSHAYRAWDVTKTCVTAEGARRFAAAFAGPSLPAYQNLNNPQFWGGIVGDMYAAAAHVSAGLRELRDGALDPSGLNGLNQVYHLLREPLENGNLPPGLPGEVRAALEGNPEQLRIQEALVDAARAHAVKFHPRLQEMAYWSHILKEQGIPQSDAVVGRKLETLDAALKQVSSGKQGDPMASLLATFQREIPPHEQEVMSPQIGDQEIDPADLVRPGAGICVVAYGHVDSPGLGAGAFTGQILDAAVQQNQDAGMVEAMGGRHADAPISFVVDEGGAARYIRRLADVVTDHRQSRISVCFSATSEHHLKDVLGEVDAGKFLHAPVVVDLTPTAEKAGALAPMFGHKIVNRTSTSTGSSGGGSTTSPHRELKVEASDVARLPRGQALLQYPSAPDGVRVRIVELKQFEDPQTVVGAVHEHVNQHPQDFVTAPAMLRELRPDLARVVEAQRNPWVAATTRVDRPVDPPAKPVDDPVEAPAKPVEAPAKPVEAQRPEPEPERPAKPVEAQRPEPEPERPAKPVEAQRPEPEPERPAKPVEAQRPEPVAVQRPEPEPERPVKPVEAQRPEPVQRPADLLERETPERPPAARIEEEPEMPATGPWAKPLDPKDEDKW